MKRMTVKKRLDDWRSKERKRVLKYRLFLNRTKVFAQAKANDTNARAGSGAEAQRSAEVFSLAQSYSYFAILTSES